MTTPGLAYRSLDEWHSWRARRARLGAFFGVKDAFASIPHGLFVAQLTPVRDPILVALDSDSPTQRAALLDPAMALAKTGEPMVILAPLHIKALLTSLGFDLLDGDIQSSQIAGLHPRSVLATSHAGGAGALAWSAASVSKVPFFIAQHGVLTPFAPPLPKDCTLLAWSDSDAEFWSSGRSDIKAVTLGSQLLYRAGTTRARQVEPRKPGAVSTRTYFLGQLHGPELPRSKTFATVSQLRHLGPVSYRPHPCETDILSRAQHRYLKALHIEVDRTRTDLVDLPNGRVVAIFSTGILEAGASGQDAFAFCKNTPTWVEEVWERYNMSPLESAQPTKVTIPETEPADSIAKLVKEASR